MKNLLDFTKLNRSKRIGLAVSAVLLAMSVAVVACTDMIVRSTPDDATSADVFSVVEQMPELVGGLASVMDDLKYPELAKNAGVEGRVLVEFVVDERGKVIHATVAEGLGSGLDEAAVAAVEKATFKPGVQNGEPVKVKMVMPITFKLSDEAGPETIGEALRKGQDAATEEVLVDRELVDQMPELIGGLEAIQKDLAYPTLAKRAGIEGRVLIEFVVGKDGAVHDARVAEGLGSGLDEEALRAVRNARFEPAMKDGRPAALTLMLPITFKLPTISTESSGAMSVTYNVADGIIEGRVIDDATGLGIGGVNVSVDGSVEGAATGPDGAFKLRLRKAGLAVDLRVTRSGFAPIVIRDAAQR